MPLKPPIPPMEAQSVDAIPVGPEWQYEPKWDGFRCLVFRRGDSVTLQSKAGKPLTRYFPDVVASARALAATTCCSAFIRRPRASKSSPPRRRPC